MTLFLVFAAVLTLAVLLWIALPLLRARTAVAPPHEAANLAVLRDQVAELDGDRDAGLLSIDDHASSRAELERRVLEETTPAHTSGHPEPKTKAIAVLLSVAICAGSLTLYAVLGEPRGIQAQTTQASAPHDIDEMIAQLARRMKEHPDDPKGWAILARSYYALGRYDEASRAYERLLKLVPEDVDVLADYADALGMDQGGDLSGRPLELLLRALRIDPTHAKTRLLLGGEAHAREDFRAALAYWEPLLAELPPDAEVTQRLRAAIEETRVKTGGPKTESARAKSLRGTVAIAPALAASVRPGDTLFVFARAAQGPRIPLAVLRLKAEQLPANFELSDANAMRPDALLSSQDAVVVGARISRSGNPLPQSGDLEGYSAVTKPGAADLRILIDRRIP
jgi:cytochrome c-type biogenesis protein CcmH